MKIEAYIKANLAAGEGSKTIDVSTLCDTTVEVNIKRVDYGTSSLKNGRNNMETGELTLETADNKCITIKCWDIEDYTGDSFDYRQWSKFDDVLLYKDTKCRVTFGRCKNGKPFIKNVERIKESTNKEQG